VPLSLWVTGMGMNQATGEGNLPLQKQEKIPSRKGGFPCEENKGSDHSSLLIERKRAGVGKIARSTKW